MKEDEVERFFEALAGKPAAPGDTPHAAETGAAVRSVLIKRIEESHSRDLDSADVGHREDLIRELRDAGHFGHSDAAQARSPSPAGSALARYVRNFSFKPRHLLLIVVVAILLAAWIEAALVPDTPGSEAPGPTPTESTPTDPADVGSPAQALPQSGPPRVETPAVVPPAATGFPPPARGAVMEPPHEAGAPASAPADPDADRIAVRISNHSGKIIRKFYIQRGESVESKREILGAAKVATGETFEVNILKRGACLYTFTAEYADATTSEKNNFDVCASQNVGFEP